MKNHRPSFDNYKQDLHILAYKFSKSNLEKSSQERIIHKRCYHTCTEKHYRQGHKQSLKAFLLCTPKHNSHSLLNRTHNKYCCKHYHREYYLSLLNYTLYLNKSSDILSFENVSTMIETSNLKNRSYKEESYNLFDIDCLKYQH